jgi:hypothetical protein
MKRFLVLLIPFALLAAVLSFVKAQAAPLVADPLPAKSEVAALITATQTITTTDIVTVSGVITGLVVNGTGGAFPPGLNVTLYVVDAPQGNMHLVYTQTASIAEDGSYIFPQVGMVIGRSFGVFVDYEGATYGSQIATFETITSTTAFSLPVTIYDSTTDASALAVEQLHVFFEFPQPGTINVSELFIISNASNRTVLAREKGGIVMSFPLPAGAVDLQFQDSFLGERYVATSNGFGDTSPVYPGTSQILLAFTLPYDRKLDFVQPVDLKVNSMGVMFQDAGARQIQGGTYQTYTGGALNAGSQIALTLSGALKLGDASATPKSNSKLSLVIGLGAFGVVLILAGVWLSRRGRAGSEEQPELEAAEADESQPAATIQPGDESQPAPEDDADALMDDIIALDDGYQAGELPEEAYRQRRAELKEKLKKLTNPE